MSGRDIEVGVIGDEGVGFHAGGDAFRSPRIKRRFWSVLLGPLVPPVGSGELAQMISTPSLPSARQRREMPSTSAVARLESA